MCLFKKKTHFYISSAVNKPSSTALMIRYPCSVQVFMFYGEEQKAPFEFATENGILGHHHAGMLEHIIEHYRSATPSYTNLPHSFGVCVCVCVCVL